MRELGCEIKEIEYLIRACHISIEIDPITNIYNSI